MAAIRLVVGSSLAVGLLVVASTANEIVFRPPEIVSAVPGVLGQRAVALAAVDLDGDHLVDLVASDGPAGSPALTTHLGHGDGTFDTFVQAPLAGLRLLAATDVDGDGLVDALVDGGGLALLRGVGDGTFAAAEPIDALRPARLFAADVDGDGAVDLVALALAPTPQVRVLRGAGDGSFTAAWTAPAPATTRDAGALADLDGDGAPDLLLADDAQLVAFLGLDASAAPPVTTLASALPGVRVLAAADFDHDGDVDLLHASASTIRIESQEPGSVFTLKREIATGAELLDLVVAELGGSAGLQDVAFTTSHDELVLLRGMTKFGFYQRTVSHLPVGRAIAVGDFDGAGEADLVVATQLALGGGQADDELRVLRNHTYPEGSPWSDFADGLAGAQGWAIVLAEGSLQTGSPWSLELCNAFPNGSAVFVAGTYLSGLPFKLGVIWPTPTVVLFGLPLDAEGRIVAAGSWPGLPPGTPICTQWWWPDPGAILGWASSSCVRLEQP